MKKNPLPTFKAPNDFKPHFVEITFKTEPDGLIGIGLKCVRYQGRYDPSVEDKKKRDMATYDMRTMIGIAARFSGLTFKPTNDKKYPVLPKSRIDMKGSYRLPASTMFTVVVRVNRKKEGELSTLIKFVQQHVKSKDSGNVKIVELDKKDPVARMLRRTARFLPAAFRNVQQPPALRRKRSDEE